MPLKIEKTTQTMRCTKCMRIHNLEYIEVNNVVTTGYRCPSHKKAGFGYFYIFSFGFMPNLRIPLTKFNGLYKHIKGDMYECNAKKMKISVVQKEMNFD